MKLSVHFPKGILKNFVESIVFMDGSSTGIAFQRMYQVIIINLETNYTVSRIYAPQPEKSEHRDTIWINGKQEVPRMIENPGTTSM